jgi:hypothetical protein
VACLLFADSGPAAYEVGIEIALGKHRLRAKLTGYDCLCFVAAPGRFRRSKVITFVPRLHLVNQMSFPIRVRQVRSSFSICFVAFCVFVVVQFCNCEPCHTLC